MNTHRKPLIDRPETPGRLCTLFISYSHDSDAHREWVLNLSERLRRDGIKTTLDQYVEGSPQQGWPRWMLDELDAADFVLVVCTGTYYQRFRGHELNGKGKGVNWEGALITQDIYDDSCNPLKFVPVFSAPADSKSIPEPLRRFTHYDLSLSDSAGYKKLLVFLLGRAGVEPGRVGSVKAGSRQQGKPLEFADETVPGKAPAVPSDGFDGQIRPAAAEPDVVVWPLPVEPPPRRCPWCWGISGILAALVVLILVFVWPRGSSVQFSGLEGVGNSLTVRLTADNKTLVLTSSNSDGGAWCQVNIQRPIVWKNPYRLSLRLEGAKKQVGRLQIQTGEGDTFITEVSGGADADDVPLAEDPRSRKLSLANGEGREIKALRFTFHNCDLRDARLTVVLLR